MTEDLHVPALDPSIPACVVIDPAHACVAAEPVHAGPVAAGVLVEVADTDVIVIQDTPRD